MSRYQANARKRKRKRSGRIFSVAIQIMFLLAGLGAIATVGLYHKDIAQQGQQWFASGDNVTRTATSVKTASTGDVAQRGVIPAMVETTTGEIAVPTTSGQRAGMFEPSPEQAIELDDADLELDW